MKYVYQEQKEKIFTEPMQYDFLKMRDWITEAIRLTGAFSMGCAISKAGISGDSWIIMAFVDRLVELEEIKEVTAGQNVAGQHRIFTSL